MPILSILLSYKISGRLAWLVINEALLDMPSNLDEAAPKIEAGHHHIVHTGRGVSSEIIIDLDDGMGLSTCAACLQVCPD